jgi:hypothetical protein
MYVTKLPENSDPPTSDTECGDDKSPLHIWFSQSHNLVLSLTLSSTQFWCPWTELWFEHQLILAWQVHDHLSKPPCLMLSLLVDDVEVSGHVEKVGSVVHAQPRLSSSGWVHLFCHHISRYVESSLKSNHHPVHCLFRLTRNTYTDFPFPQHYQIIPPNPHS